MAYLREVDLHVEPFDDVAVIEFPVRDARAVWERVETRVEDGKRYPYLLIRDAGIPLPKYDEDAKITWPDCTMQTIILVRMRNHATELPSFVGRYVGSCSTAFARYYAFAPRRGKRESPERPPTSEEAAMARTAPR